MLGFPFSGFECRLKALCTASTMAVRGEKEDDNEN